MNRDMLRINDALDPMNELSSHPGRGELRSKESEPMRTKSASMRLVMPLVLVCSVVLCEAQWLTQQVPLTPGWNAVFLELQPEPRSCDELFKNYRIESVWKWDRRFSTIQFTVDPATLLPENPDWLMWLPPSEPRAFLNRLFELQGCQAYLIKVASNAAPLTLAIKGRVILPRLDWYPHGLNLVGLPVHPKNPPTFTEFFSFTSEVDTSLGYANQLYRLESSGRGRQIVQPARERIQPGVAYWIGCARRPEHTAAIHVKPNGGSVDFGTLLSRNELSIRNPHRERTLTVRLQQRISEGAPLTGGFPEVAGPVPLSILTKDAASNWIWTEFPANGLTRDLAPKEEWILQLGLRRQDLTPFTPQRTNGFIYASLLEITDTAESILIRLPVVAQGTGGLLASGTSGIEAVDTQEGLWVGQATVNQVTAPAYTEDLLPTPSPLPFRLLVHVDGNGQASLLQQVVLAWDSTLVEPPHTNGAYAIYAEAADLPANATNVARISSAAFPIMPPVALTNYDTNTGIFGSPLAGTFVVRYDDPVNPFLHRYHPRHDNKNWTFEPYSEPVETRTIQRDLTLEFTPVTNAPANPFWGVDSVKGIYHETFSGLRAQPLRVQGEFTLQRISRINRITP